MSLTLNALTSTVVSPDLYVSRPAPPAKASNKLAEAAKQFEALMIGQMMKSARETSGGGWLSDGGETGEDSAMSLAEAQFAQSMASAGGLGLAKMIVRTMGNAVSNVSAPRVDGD